MSMITSKILKFVDSAKTLKSTHLEDETFFSSNKKKITHYTLWAIIWQNIGFWQSSSHQFITFSCNALKII